MQEKIAVTLLFARRGSAVLTGTTVRRSCGRTDSFMMGYEYLPLSTSIKRPLLFHGFQRGVAVCPRARESVMLVVQQISTSWFQKYRYLSMLLPYKPYNATTQQYYYYCGCTQIFLFMMEVLVLFTF